MLNGRSRYDNIMNNGCFITKEIDWATQVIVARLNQYFKHTEFDFNSIIPPELNQGQGAYCDYVCRHNLKSEDRLCLVLAVIPILKPQLFDCFNVKNSNTDQRFVEFGCVERDGGSGVLPTLNTLLFILVGDDVEKKIQLTNYFASRDILNKNVLFPDSVLSPTDEFISEVLFEKRYAPAFSTTFPARKITTTRSWEDLVLDNKTMKQIDDIKLWIDNGNRLLDEWNLRGKIKNGYRALFYGTPGTGKTFTATLLGKVTGRDVYCVDLSMVVSKYVGETEKNLSNVFDVAEGKNWILFFDEADALFGKRTGVKDSHDRYANQEVAYLLQRVENYDGLVILSTNQKTNIDDAFARRFQSAIRFSMPNAEERKKLWMATFSEKSYFEEKIDIDDIASRYEIAGGAILNVVQYCSLMAISRNDTCIRNDDLIEGVRREFEKEGRVFV